MKQILLLAMLAYIAPLLAQEPTKVEGVIYDSAKQPIPFAHIRYKETLLTVADSQGYFALTLPERGIKDSITITAIGFVTIKVAIKDHSPNGPLKVTMSAETFLINGVTISNNKAKNHWLLALEKLKAQLPSASYTYPALFRQVHLENGTYVRLIEAGMTVYDVAATYSSAILQERFNLEQVRRSNVLERNGDAHGDHLVDMLLENNLRYPTGTIMDAKSVAQFEISYDDSHCDICGDSLEQLAYKYEMGNDPKILEGKIWLYQGSLKLYGLEETATRNPQYVERGMALGGGDNHWMFQESRKTLHFAYVDHKIYLSSLHFAYLHHIQDRTIGVVRYELTESFSLYCDRPVLHPEGFVPDRGYARSGNLYSRKYDYEESFWQRFSLAIAHPLPNEVVQTFSSKVPLKEQFRRNGQ